MAFDPTDFEIKGTSKKTHIQTTNGDHVQIEGSGQIHVSENKKLPNYLFITNLSYKL